MSFMGAVGTIMAGSGLKEVWSIIYAAESTNQMMTGHSYSRALRAHYITQLALTKILLETINLDDSTRTALPILHSDMMQKGSDVTENII